MYKTITYTLNKHIWQRWKPSVIIYRHVLLTVFAVSTINFAMAQQSTSDSIGRQYKKAVTDTQSITVEDNPAVLSLTGGTTGFGAQVKKMLGYNLGLAAGYSFLPKLSFDYKATADFNNTSTYSGNFSKAQLLLEYSPFKSLGIRLVGGGAYIFALKTTINRVATGNYTYGDIVYTPSEIGRVDILADWKGPAAYLGLGFFRIVPKRRFNITFDFGTYYLSQPKTSITGTELLAVNASENNEEHWHENVSQYRWLPVLQLNLNFRLGKIDAL